MKNSKYKWGQCLKPTKLGIRNCGLKKTAGATSLGKTRDGYLVLVQENRRTVDIYHGDFWKIDENTKLYRL